jgi:hypothetical protein
MEQLVGVTLMTLALLDVFLTVLYARAGTGIFARRVSHVLWWVFRHLSRSYLELRGDRETAGDHQPRLAPLRRFSEEVAFDAA